MKKEFPILEFDTSKRVIIDPQQIIKPLDISEYCMVCFFQEVITKIFKQGKSKIINYLQSEMGKHPVYEMVLKGKRITFFHPGVGAPLAAALLEEVIALGCKKRRTGSSGSRPTAVIAIPPIVACSRPAP